MSKLPRISAKEAIRIFEQLGFKKIRQKGSHVVLKKQILGNSLGCVIPLHKELATGTLKGILRQAKVKKGEFMKILIS